MPRTLEENRALGDSWHEIVEDVKLKYGAELHRFKNCAGVDMSAIYINDVEALWSLRRGEASIIKAWNKNGRGITKVLREFKEIE